MKANTKPQRNSAHRKEDKSKREFEDLIDPFFVQGWNTKDYGIDAIVEITTPLDNFGNAGLESKCFLVQLKATEKLTRSGNHISFAVPVKKILYWYSYNLPVLFVLYDLASECFYRIWIDEFLIAELDSQNNSWAAQKSITLKIPTQNKLAKKDIDALKDYVLKWKMPSRRKLEPGKYFSLKELASTHLQNYKSITQNFNLASINEGIKNIEIALELSLYRVALTGLSRVGKSSLINGLLKKPVSPTGFFQTTGVPIQVIPGIEDKITIYFHSSPSMNFPFSLKNIEEYASQDYNEDNKKQVRLISVSVKNNELERGVSLFDIPGLDDPSDEILSYTWQTVKTVNAVVYVIDASTAQDGGYIFKNEYKKHITSFSQLQDKVFLVFNKVDRLSEEVLIKLKNRVVMDLAKHGLTESIGDRVFFLSAEKNNSCVGSDTIDALNEKLWAFILDENKSGIVKLSLINQELYASTKSLLEILGTRLLSNKKRGELQTAINTVRSKTLTLESDITLRQQNLKKSLLTELDNRKHSILTELENNLKKIDLSADLPSSNQIKKYLLDNINLAIEKSNGEYLVQINQLKNYIDSWIEDNLKQLREILKYKPEQKQVDFTEIETFESPQIDYSSAWGMGFIGMAAAYFFAPAYMFAAGVIGFFGNLFTSAESRRAKQISRIMEKSKGSYDNSFAKIKNAYTEICIEHFDFLTKYRKQRLNYYFKDLEDQLSQLQQQFSPEQIQAFKKACKETEDLQKQLNELDAELRSFHFSR